MKPKKLISKSLLLLLAFLTVSFIDPYSVKRISDENYRYEFYKTSKTITPKLSKTYFWFKGGLIHNAQSGIGGELLNAKFVKMYHSNQLAEQGMFRKGLKKGLWKTWYSSGVLESIQVWSNGVRAGMFFKFNENGELVEKGRFTNNMKFGKWIDFIKKDTIVYFRDIPKNKSISKIDKFDSKESKFQKSNSNNQNTYNTRKPNFFRRLFSKKQN